MYLIQERPRGGEWYDTLPALATYDQAEDRIEDVIGMADPRYEYRIAEVDA